MSESKMKPRLRAEELTGMISLLRDKFVRSENLRRCCFVPMRRNSVLDGLRSSLFKFIQERMRMHHNEKKATEIRSRMPLYRYTCYR